MGRSIEGAGEAVAPPWQADVLGAREARRLERRGRLARLCAKVAEKIRAGLPPTWHVTTRGSVTFPGATGERESDPRTRSNGWIPPHPEQDAAIMHAMRHGNQAAAWGRNAAHGTWAEARAKLAGADRKRRGPAK